MAVIVAQAALMVGQASAANPAANLDQCANDPLPSSHLDGCNSSSTQWVNGNLGASKSVYFEGDSIPYRMRFSSLPLVTHTVTIQWDTTKSSKHAIDYLTTVNKSVADANPCLGVSGCNPLVFNTAPIPSDPQVTGAGVTPPAGTFRLYGGTITNVGAYSYPNGAGFTGDKTAQIAITFTASVANPVLAWGGHISTRTDWGATGSAVNISGSPYHTRLIDLDGAGGNQDRSLSADAVIFPGSITIIKDTVPDDSHSFGFTDTGGLSPTSFSLVDDGTNANNSRTFSNITNFTTYTFTEGAASNYTLSFHSPVCTVTSPNSGTQSGNTTTRTVTIGLKEGENVTCTFVNTHANATPGITTTATATATVGDKIHDVAHLTGLVSPDGTGTVTFTAFSASDCNALSQVFTSGSTPAFVTANGDYTSGDYTTTAVGTIYWIASFSGDGNNGTVSTACGDTNESSVVTAPPPVSQITPTATTCAQFKAGTAGTLSRVDYSVRNGNISQVSPGVFFYWVTVTAAPGMNTFTINQTITTGNFSTFFTVASGSSAFTSTCTKVSTGISQNSSGTVSVAFNAGTGGTFIIGIKYSTGAVVGKAAPSPTTVHYDFSTAGVAGSTSGIDLKKKGTP
jgi:hypothetical protein